MGVSEYRVRKLGYCEQNIIYFLVLGFKIFKVEWFGGDDKIQNVIM